MSLRITDTEMTSDTTRHRAELLPNEGWRVSWLPLRRLTRDQAVTAMTLAEAVARMQREGRTTVVDHTHRLWPHVDAWAAELGLTGPDAVARASEPAHDAPASGGGPTPQRTRTGRSTVTTAETTGTVPPLGRAGTTAAVHVVCCDANVALCGQALAGGDRYVTDPASCPLCTIAAALDLPCAAPGCDVGTGSEVAALLARQSPAARPVPNGCADPNCPGGRGAVPDPDGRLCGGCRAAAFDTPYRQHGPEDIEEDGQ